ncbi:MAG: hypothetical protein ACOY3O_05350 [Thermodesulfobacteriota bacterium]
MKQLFILDGDLIYIEVNMRLFKIVLFFNVFCLLLGCSIHAGINRTPLGKSSIVQFNSVGFSITLPEQSDSHENNYRIDVRDSDVFRANAKLKGKVYFGFHPIYGAHSMSEPDYLIDINMARFSKEQFELLKKGRHYLLSDPCCQNMNIKLSTEIIEMIANDKYNNKDYRCFFKAISYDNGDVLVCSGRLLLTNNFYTENDISFIRYLIGSVALNQ